VAEWLWKHTVLSNLVLPCTYTSQEKEDISHLLNINIEDIQANKRVRKAGTEVATFLLSKINIVISKKMSKVKNKNDSDLYTIYTQCLVLGRYRNLYKKII
jgi:hypothetical protein